MDDLCGEGWLCHWHCSLARRQPQQQWPGGGTPPGSTISGSHLAPVLRRALALAVGELLDAVVDSNAALARSQVLLGDLHPAQRAHSEALSRDPGAFSTQSPQPPLSRTPGCASVTTPALAPTPVSACPILCQHQPAMPSENTPGMVPWSRPLCCAGTHLHARAGRSCRGTGDEGRAPTQQHKPEAPGKCQESLAPSDPHASSWKHSMEVTSMRLLASSCRAALLGNTGASS